MMSSAYPMHDRSVTGTPAPRLVGVIATALACVALASVALGENEFGPQDVPAAAEPFTIGSLKAFTLHDAQFVVRNDGKIFGANVKTQTVGELLKANHLPDDRVTLSVNALLVRIGDRVILIDSGLGYKVHGALIASLAEAGVSPEEVTDVLITHSHGDHVGGLTDAAGKLAFPKAVIRLSSAEWTWMKSQKDAADLVKAIDGHVQTFAAGAQIAPGLTAVPLEGHTPGHEGYEIVSGSQRLLDIGDLAHSSVISLQRPDWIMAFDNDTALAKTSRETTLGRLAKTHEAVFSPHFPYPGVGHIVAEGKAYTWVPDKF